jgi:DNA-binding NarL/FixJ family response regulator
MDLRFNSLMESGAPSGRVLHVLASDGDSTLRQLAEATTLELTECRSAVDALVNLGLAAPIAGGRIALASSELAIDAFLHRQQVTLTELQSKITYDKSILEHLLAGSRERRLADSGDVERVFGEAQIQERLTELSAATAVKMATFSPGGALPREHLLAGRERTAALFERGVTSRTIYLSAVRNDKPTREHVEWLQEHGSQVRTASVLPVRMILFDDDCALLPANLEDAMEGVVVVRNPGILVALHALYEQVWASASVFGNPKARPDGLKLDDDERALLGLLVEGLTYDNVGKRTGWSKRTVNTKVQTLMSKVGAVNPFTLGARAKELGFI